MRKLIVFSIALLISAVSFAGHTVKIKIANNTMHDITTKLNEHICVNHPHRLNLRIPAGEVVSQEVDENSKGTCFFNPSAYRLSMYLDDENGAWLGTYVKEFVNGHMRLHMIVNQSEIDPNSVFTVTRTHRHHRVIITISEIPGKKSA